MALTKKQKAFADNYLIVLNAAEAARRAGYKEKAAAQMGYENLRKPEIKAYIHERLRELDHTADLEETMAFLTKVMRGEVKDQFGLDASVADRLRASEALLKRFAAAEEKAEGSGPRQIVFTMRNNSEEFCK